MDAVVGAPAAPREATVSHTAVRLIARLIMQQLVVGAITAAVLIVLAQRLLLLDAQVIDGSISLIVGGSIATFTFVIIATLVVTYRVRPALHEIAAGRNALPASFVLELYAVPARLVLMDMLGALVISAATFLPFIRPETNDLHTQVELVLLTMTIVSVAALPGYVLMRASVARVIELVDVRSSREALVMLEAGTRLTKAPRAEQRMRQRLFAALAAPVAFVALGASLLVHAHVRAFDTTSREDDAKQLVRGVLDVVNGSTTGRAQSIEEAREHGFFPEIAREQAKPSVTRNDQGETRLTAPVADGHAVVRFNAARVSPSTGVYVLLALLATGLAGLLGSQLGRAFASDVALATREVHAMGAADVIKGTRILGDPRFSSVSALMHAIDQLGGIFREFAAAQERAIDARTATERMRGLFLASMSHDLKAPLNSILGFAELVSRGELTDAQHESVVIVEQRGRELLYLIDTILDVARVEAGQLSIVPEWTKVGDVVMSAVMDARDLVIGLDVQVVGEIQPGVPRLLVDPPRTAQALTAVILVAARFADQGMVHVRATLPAAGERLRIDVETTGRGLSTADRDRLFETFKYADRARRHGSLGLGPSLARSLLEMHGGTIDVETTHGESGLVFHVWLPSSSNEVVPPSAEGSRISVPRA